MAGRKYSIEFKIQATKRVVEEGVSSAQVARELGINVNSLRDWESMDVSFNSAVGTVKRKSSPLQAEDCYRKNELPD